ncbi:MAG TPA: HPr family phosphocarrier protein [Hypericibacter adhaerens]|jgi:phosphocarrier protein|nr:HPr family phosphocarrier protein [Hypericibacter adhaerens]HWA44212.1 HPr family phosphocarrier protein [Hypericibacter adhaerens]
MADATERSIVITHQVGLHARPSVKLTKLAKSFDADIRVRGEGTEDWVDAKSIVRVMGLKLREGTTIFFKADGPDAAQALDALVGLVERDFDEHAA